MVEKIHRERFTLTPAKSVMRSLAFAKNYYTRFNELSAAQLQRLLFFFFWLSIVLFPLGYITRELLPTICLLILARYYKIDWKNASLRQFKLKWVIYILFIGVFVGILFSIDPINSFIYVFKHINMGFAYPLIAMECVKSTKDLENIIYAFVIASFWEGCDGIYQSITGYDFIDHTEIIQSSSIKNGRLTGSLNDYRVGNYMALTLIPASALFVLLRRKMQPVISLAITCITLFPGLYLLYFSYTRNAYFTLAVAAAVLFVFHTKKINVKKIAIAVSGLLFIVLSWVFIVPERFGLHIILHDGRWDLWRIAWAVFLQHPWTGVGFWNFNAAFRSMGLVPAHDPITISHPHDIYLQILCESGIIGELCFLIFLFTFLFWGCSKVKAGLRQSTPGTAPHFHWKLAAFFATAWVSYMASGIVGHDFFRDWWFAQAMILLGCMIAACLCVPSPCTDEQTASE